MHQPAENPTLAVHRWSTRDYLSRIDAGVLSTTVKRPVFAEAGIAEYWVADAEGERLIVHRAPEGGSYRSVVELSGDDVVRPLALPELSLRVGDLFK